LHLSPDAQIKPARAFSQDCPGLERVQVKWNPVYRSNARQSKDSGAGRDGEVLPLNLNPL
jgi:hypothetical protein